MVARRLAAASENLLWCRFAYVCRFCFVRKRGAPACTVNNLFNSVTSRALQVRMDFLAAVEIGELLRREAELDVEARRPKRKR
jgi:hypothetical protein